MRPQKPLCLFLLCLCLLLSACAPREALLYVNGEAVPEAELELLDGNVDKAVRMKVLQQWAAEEDLIDPFSYEQMLLDLEEENRSRAEQAAAGEVVYGLTEYTPLQFYSMTMNEYRELLKDRISQNASREDLLQYYVLHEAEYQELGTVTAEVTVSAVGKVVSSFSAEVDSSNFRSFSEQYEVLANTMIEMCEGERRSWTDEYGQEWVVDCTGNEGYYLVAFEDVQSAVASQYSAAALEEELQNRIDCCNIQDLRKS